MEVPQPCPSCHNMAGILLIPKTAGDILQAIAAMKEVAIQKSAAGGCPFCELVSQIWNHDMNRDWREYHTDRGHVCQSSLSWMNDGPVVVEFFYPFAECIMGKDREVPSVGQPGIRSSARMLVDRCHTLPLQKTRRLAMVQVKQTHQLD
tara:strand:- start:292 stop:738 length:447 start_codon:yes stop_codon:yes gene_type:complete